MLKQSDGFERWTTDRGDASGTAGRTSDGMLAAAGTGDDMGEALGLALGPGDVVVSLGTSGTVFTRTIAPSAMRRAPSPNSPMPPDSTYPSCAR